MLEEAWNKLRPWDFGDGFLRELAGREPGPPSLRKAGEHVETRDGPLAFGESLRDDPECGSAGDAEFECHAGYFDQAQCVAQRVVRVAECLRDSKVFEDELGSRRCRFQIHGVGQIPTLAKFQLVDPGPEARDVTAGLGQFVT